MTDLTRLTGYEREMLAQLLARPGQPHTPAEMISDNPAVFGRRTPQGLHMTAASLARKGLVYRASRAGSGYVGYQIKPGVIPDVTAELAARPAGGTA